MPFSRTGKSTLYYHKTNKKFAALQAQTLSKNFCATKEPTGKKVFPSISASMTPEAALVLSLLIFAVAALILPMKIMNTERQIQAALEQAGEDFSRAAYLKYTAETGGDLAQEGREILPTFLTEAAGVIYVHSVVRDHISARNISQISLVNSSILEDGEYIDLVMDYEVRLPFPLPGLPALQRTARCRRRAWIGAPGKDYSGSSADGNEEDELIVYVGKDSTRYHLRRNCHYLYNDLRCVSAARLKELRNSSGSRYRPCAVCGGSSSAQVYIMPSGESYHTNPECTAVLAYVRAVRLSEVQELGACSYCGM